jgi:hypothetical protein
MGVKKMAEERMAHNEKCGSDGHNEHLCFLMYEGFHLKNKEAYKQMVQDAQYRCQNCGRTAKSEENLCAPIAL